MTSASRIARLLRRLVRVSCRRPLLTVVVSLALAAVSILYTLHGLTFKTSGRDVLPPDAGYVLRYQEYAREFGELEDIVVVVEARSFAAAKAYASRLVQELRAGPVKFPRVTYRVDPKRFEGRQLLYLSRERLDEIRAKIFDYQEFMESFAVDPSLAQLVEGINAQFAQGVVANLFDVGLQGGTAMDTRFLRLLLEQIDQRLEQPAPYRSPWGTLFSLGGETAADAGYFTSEDRSLLFVLVEPPKGDTQSFVSDQRAIDAIRETIARLRPVFPTVQAGVTGAPALSNDEMAAAFGDSELAGAISFALTLLLMIVAFKRTGMPIVLTVVLTVSLAWSMGLTTLTVGHLTLFSVMFISIVVGVGIDYGIYFLFRYEEETFLGRSLPEALEITAERTGPGILLSALTAAATFYVLMLTDFRGIQELGYIAGTAILLAWLSMMTLFPATLVLFERRRATPRSDAMPRAHQLEHVHVPLLEHVTGRPRLVLAIAAVLTLASLWAVPSIGFDYNLLNLQAAGTESVVWEKRVLANTGRSGFNALASAGSLAELRQKQEAFERLPSVSEVDSVLRLIPDGQAEKIAIIRSFAPLVAPVRIGRSSSVDLDRLTQALENLKRRFDLAASEGDKALPAEVKQLQNRTVTLLAHLRKTEREVAEPALSHLQAQLYRDFVEKFHGLQRNLKPRPISLTDVPEELKRKFVGAHGKFLIQVHPKVDIWERAGAEQFVRELRSVDPDVTGSPVITYEAIRLMERAYMQGTAYAFVVVGLLSYAMIRRVRETLLAMLPLVIGLLWTFGLMRLFGLQFTLANIWGLPLIVGSSAEFGLSVVASYLEGREHGGPLLTRSTVMGVAISGLTTVVGFGSLMVAHHQGVFGLGLLLTIGATCATLASLVVLPVVLRLIPRPAPRAVPDSASTALPG
jgi:uncharacterized protein